MSKLFEELKNSQEYIKVAKELSNEELSLAEQAIFNMLKEFEIKVLSVLEVEVAKNTKQE